MVVLSNLLWQGSHFHIVPPESHSLRPNMQLAPILLTAIADLATSMLSHTSYRLCITYMSAKIPR